MQFDEKALHEVRQTRFLINRVDDWIYEEITPFVGNRVLEVGCGLGNLFPRLHDRELIFGIDTSEESIRELKQRFIHAPNIQAQVYDICDPAVLDLKPNAFDTIISLNVLEHIADDTAALVNMRQLLTAGHLVVIVPAHSWLYGTMDSSIGHFRRYDKEQMQVKLSQAGFEIVMQRYLNFAGALGWFVSGKILRKKTPPANQLRLFNLLVPFLRYIEANINSPVGVSLLSVAR
ncbi:MAG TPA: class I SAM-dependent methyltransferase [Anaerolineae bacterium]|nr:class I SAM-dependent methyltransferase [Anaerolineae bacterium]HQI83142.1 class I SAM-dependent methyltransferase [Anaerolineae bacterium]